MKMALLFVVASMALFRVAAVTTAPRTKLPSKMAMVRQGSTMAEATTLRGATTPVAATSTTWATMATATAGATAGTKAMEASSSRVAMLVDTTRSALVMVATTRSGRGRQPMIGTGSAAILRRRWTLRMCPSSLRCLYPPRLDLLHQPLCPRQPQLRFLLRLQLNSSD